MNLNPELGRYILVLERDGKAEADLYAQRAYRTYRGRCRTLRAKYGKNHVYRREYQMAAYALRPIMRGILGG